MIAFPTISRGVVPPTTTFPSGYDDEFTPGPKHAVFQRLATRDLAVHQNAIHWVLDKYGARPVGELELLSTIVHADRETNQAGRRMSFDELVRTVKCVKPRFSDAVIQQNVKDREGDELLVASSARD